MGTYGISTDAEAEAVLARLRELPEQTYEGVPQGFDLNRNMWGEKPGYRDVTFGSVNPTQATGRNLGLGEEDQPHGWSIEVAHTAVTKAEVRALCGATDAKLIGWAPSENMTPLKPFFYVQYTSRSLEGAIVSWTGVRFYNNIVGVLTP